MSDTSPLAGRSALVTGASRGVGRRVVARLTEAGARVFALARSADALAALSRETGAEAVPVDLTDEEATWNALDGVCDTVGSAPDFVVNAAGVFGLEPVASESVRAFDEHISVNLRGPFLVIRSLLPAMLERGSGLVVNVGSVAGWKPLPGNASYSASKYGLRGLHEVLAEELRGTGVRTTLVEPAATDTSMWDPLDPDARPDLPDRDAMLSVDAVADAILYAVTRPDDVCIPLLRIESS